MNYTSKNKENQQLSHLIICIALPSKSSEPKNFKHHVPQKRDYILNTPGLSCDMQAKLFELLRCEPNSGSKVTQDCTKSITERQVFELCTSEIIEWPTSRKTNWRLLKWWAVTHPFFATETLFKDEYGMELIVVVTGYRGGKGAGQDA